MFINWGMGWGINCVVLFYFIVVYIGTVKEQKLFSKSWTKCHLLWSLMREVYWKLQLALDLHTHREKELDIYSRNNYVLMFQIVYYYMLNAFGKIVGAVLVWFVDQLTNVGIVRLDVLSRVLIWDSCKLIMMEFTISSKD